MVNRGSRAYDIATALEVLEHRSAIGVQRWAWRSRPRRRLWTSAACSSGKTARSLRPQNPTSWSYRSGGSPWLPWTVGSSRRCGAVRCGRPAAAVRSRAYGRAHSSSAPPGCSTDCRAQRIGVGAIVSPSHLRGLACSQCPLCRSRRRLDLGRRFRR